MGSMLSSERCDVFVSFREEDTRNGFTGHLCAALEKNKVKPYVDENKIGKGDEISPVLSKAIKRAKLSVIVFSEKYATSSRCLDELVKILRCKEKRGQIVVPVFYGVDPSDVRKQEGSFVISEALESAYGKRKEKAWREALKTASSMSGWDIQTSRSEAKLIEEIVKDVMKKLEALRKKEEEAAMVGAAVSTIGIGT